MLDDRYSIAALLAGCVFEDEMPTTRPENRAATRAKFTRECEAAVGAGNVDHAMFLVTTASRELGWIDPAVRGAAAAVGEMLVTARPPASAYGELREFVNAVRDVGCLDAPTVALELHASIAARMLMAFSEGAEHAKRGFWLAMIVSGRANVHSQRTYDIAVDAMASAGELESLASFLNRVMYDIRQEPPEAQVSVNGATIANVAADLWHTEYLQKSRKRESRRPLFDALPASGMSPARAARTHAVAGSLAFRYGMPEQGMEHFAAALAVLDTDAHEDIASKTNSLCEITWTLVLFGRNAEALELSRRLRTIDAEKLPPLSAIARGSALAAVKMHGGVPKEALFILGRLEALADRLPRQLAGVKRAFLYNLASAELVTGNRELTLAHLERTLAPLPVGCSRRRPIRASDSDLLSAVAIEYNLARCDELAGNLRDASRRLELALFAIDLAAGECDPLFERVATYYSYLKSKNRERPIFLGKRQFRHLPSRAEPWSAFLLPG